MRLSEIKGEMAIDTIANIMDPLVTLLSDTEIRDTVRSTKSKLIIGKVILTRQKKAILEILAYLNGENPEDFNPSLIELPIMIKHLIEDIAENEELMELFRSQSLKTEGASSGSVTEPTTETEEI